jgi:two-component system sensor histidine kinase ChiS
VPRPKILIVEDDPVQIQILQTRLGTEGFDVAVAKDGVQGVGMVRREKPSLILLDIGLPGGDGYLVIKRLKALTPAAKLPVIVVSARPAEQERDRMIAAGAEDYFQKPLDYPALFARIHALLGQAAAAEAAARPVPGRVRVVAPFHS